MSTLSRRVLSTACAAALLACASFSLSANASVITTNQAGVQGCTPLGQISSPSPRYTLSDARLDFDNKAQSLGATHVVESNVGYKDVDDTGTQGYVVNGTAYKCSLGDGATQTTTASLLEPSTDMPHPEVNS